MKWDVCKPYNNTIKNFWAGCCVIEGKDEQRFQRLLPSLLLDFHEFRCRKKFLEKGVDILWEIE
jgi:hypothetical protein